MAYTGKFLVNNASFSPLIIDGIGTFNAFSGDHQYRNRGGCTMVPNDGPIPAGRYWIVDRPTGGARSQAYAWAKDTYNSIFGTPSDHREWFALYRDDGFIDDWTWVNGVKRGQFRLHPAGGQGISLGCITLPSRTDFMRIRNALMHTVKIPVRSSGLSAYGTIEVITYGSTCPWGVQGRSVLRPVLSLLALCPHLPLADARKSIGNVVACFALARHP